MILGATRKINDETGMQANDKKGRPLWNMPEPVGTVKHKVRFLEKQRFGDKIVRIPQTKLVEVPVYKGYSRSFIRYARSQFRYHQKLAERRRIAQAKADYEAYEGDIWYDKEGLRNE